MECETEFASS